ncbi:penicillin-binding protein 1B [Zooshikella ganghwensis]|uniref:penicillin-binding protein 1B n=1 Tax=Zooshikella ganghwensis TaxID=202772 RepID=UPI000A04A6CC|nr:penicillin-binding protein 1B [Zooshikella ganghwensis]
MSKSDPNSTNSQPQKPVKKFRLFRTLIKLCLLIMLVVGVVAGVYLYRLDTVVTAKFEGKKWDIPAKVYARPLELYEGLQLSPDTFALQLKQLGYQRKDLVDSPGEVMRKGTTYTLYTRGFQFEDGAEPAQQVSVTFNQQSVKALKNNEGESVPLVRLEPLLIGGIYPDSNEDRIITRLEELPDMLIPTLLAVEDRKFYQHYGVSFKAIARAAWINFRSGATVQGGSTLTQQLVKNFYLSSERSFKRKLSEAAMAFLLELHYSKDDILETYLNEVYLGQEGKRAIHGFGLASQFYFGKPISELELHQVALLVGIVKGPSEYDPRRQPKKVLKRRNLVLKVMAKLGHITQEEAQKAIEKPLDIVKSNKSYLANAYAYLDLVKRQLREEYNDEDLTSEGLSVFTNLDPVIQMKAQTSVTETINKLKKAYPKHKDLQGAMVVTAPNSGDVLAIVGAVKPGYAGFNRALDAERSIGSLVKPAIYLTALSFPEQFNLATLIDDDSITIRSDTGEVWEPKNYDRKSHGWVPLHRALAKSYNLSTVRLGMEVGLSEVIHTLQQLGVGEELKPFPAMLLGAINLKPIQVAQVYQTIAAGGFQTPMRTIRAVLTANGATLQRYELALEQKVDERFVHLVQYSMQEVMREGTGRGAYSVLPGKLRLAGKTGTTNDRRDSWFAGYGDNLLSVVWIGKDNNESTPLTGSSGALKVWSDFMKKANVRSLQPIIPEGVNYLWVDEATGLRSQERCPGARYLPFVSGFEPLQEAGCYRANDGYDRRNGYPQRRRSNNVIDWFKSIFR